MGTPEKGQYLPKVRNKTINTLVSRSGERRISHSQPGRFGKGGRRVTAHPIRQCHHPHPLQCTSDAVDDHPYTSCASKRALKKEGGVSLYIQRGFGIIPVLCVYIHLSHNITLFLILIFKVPETITPRVTSKTCPTSRNN
ncbi:unnamed protein product, partial [Ectocarpus sp. 13 AM-2016]